MLNQYPASAVGSNGLSRRRPAPEARPRPKAFGAAAVALIAAMATAISLFAAPLLAAPIVIDTVMGFPNGRTVGENPPNAVDGNTATFTWTTNPNNTQTPAYLAIGFKVQSVNRLRLWKESYGGGGNNSKNLVILYTIDSGPLDQRQWIPVTHLNNGFIGSELMRARSVLPDGTVAEDAHNSTGGDGWASLTFDSVTATGLAIAFSNPFPVGNICNGLSVDQPCNHYRVGEFQAYFEITTEGVYEFYNETLDNFFITASRTEAAAIDGGSAGPGWVRTGGAFNFGSAGNVAVCRFYGSLSPGPNSHFYTASMDECNALKALQATTPPSVKRWNYESLDFLTTQPINGACPSNMKPVYRAYNNGFNRNVDSNHRITTSQQGIIDMVAKGWISEGVVMCAPKSGTDP